jgi:hypothetical protein
MFCSDPAGLIERDLQHAAFALQNPGRHLAEHIQAGCRALADGRPFDALHHAFGCMGEIDPHTSQPMEW